jgi:predicted transcriptional regulator
MDAISSNLFPSTSQLAHRVAARFRKTRYLQILSLLETRPRCIFEAAHALDVLDHKISGRFGEMVKELLIERSGQRRPTPSGSPANEYRLTIIGLAWLKAHSNQLQPQVEAGGEDDND